MAGHGPGHCSGVCGWGVLAVLIGKLQIGNLKLSRLSEELGGGKMVTENKPVVIEIPEEAYKQNTVYRPWPEIKASVTVGKPDTRHLQPR
jgi:hypothetical protein